MFITVSQTGSTSCLGYCNNFLDSNFELFNLSASTSSYNSQCDLLKLR
jgi:hypothetical protein